MNKQNQTKSLTGTSAGTHAGAKKPKIILNVLIACEESQAECEAFRDLGHNAFSCDIQPCRKGGHPEWHIKGDVRPYLKGYPHFVTMDGKYHSVYNWDLIIAHPPCTYLCKVGSLHLYKNKDGWRKINGEWKEVNTERYKKMLEGRKFFLECLAAKADYLAVENPIPMRAAQLPQANSYACPSWYGFNYTKKTLYWLRNLPDLMAEVISTKVKCLVTSARGKYRSRTYPGLARAIAEQWSEYIINQKTKL